MSINFYFFLTSNCYEGTVGNDQAMAVANSLGNIYVTGVTYGNLNGQTNVFPFQCFLMKYNIASVLQWTFLFGPSTTCTAGDKYLT